MNIAMIANPKYWERHCKLFRSAVGNEVIVKLVSEEPGMMVYSVPAEYASQWNKAVYQLCPELFDRIANECYFSKKGKS